MDKPAPLQRICNIVNLPTELLFRIMSFLSMGSIRNLIANRSLRSVCEQGLYQNISLPYHTFRSIRLLQTFLLRPDLALLVRHLEIWFNFDTSCEFSRMPEALRVNGLGALSLAKNICSLSLRGDVDWIWEASKDELRKAVSKMRLVRLEVPVLLDPHARQHGTIYDGWEYLRRNSHVDLGANVRRLLQAQPHLEEFKFSDSVEDITSRSVASLRACLQASDIPNLKSLKAPPEVAMVSLPLASRLESLDLMTADWDDRLLSEIETKAIAIKLCTRRFVIRVSNFYHDQWFWNNLNNVFTLFPNLEYLSITVNSMTTAHRVGPARFWVVRRSSPPRAFMPIHSFPRHRQPALNDYQLIPELTWPWRRFILKRCASCRFRQPSCSECDLHNNNRLPTTYTFFLPFGRSRFGTRP